MSHLEEVPSNGRSLRNGGPHIALLSKPMLADLFASRLDPALLAHLKAKARMEQRGM
jgi:hypothetical protein